MRHDNGTVLNMENTESKAEEIAAPDDNEIVEDAQESESSSDEDMSTEEEAPVDEEAQPPDELAELRDQHLRLRAEFDNYRKRISRENERFRKRAAEGILNDLLPVLDNLERALRFKDEVSSDLADGVQMVHDQMVELVARHGVKSIAAIGEKFDPQYHEAIAQVPSDEIPKDDVAEEFQRGYTLHDQVLRPSKVTVSTGPETVTGEQDDEAHEPAADSQ
ncbi:MAG: nucleotide exchange factor GrpE [Candidatus Hydrogenedentes bacterium]|nr:nucleotide exchange factor GrpE [Candidatus Hydrogenedentota bacterium]